MPLRYVNPAPMRRKARVKSIAARLASKRSGYRPRPRVGSRPPGVPRSNGKRKLRGAAKAAFLKRMAAGRAKRVRSRSATTKTKRRRRSNPPTKRKKMAKKLYGAAAKAHAKKMARKRRGGTSRKRRRSTRASAPRRRRRRSVRFTRKERSALAKMRKAAGGVRRRARSRRSWEKKRKTHGMQGPVENPRRRRRRRRRSARANPAPYRRRRRSRARVHRRRTHARRRRRVHARRTTRRRRRKNPARRRSHARRRYRRNPRRSTVRSMMRARRSIRNRKDRMGSAYARRYRMRSNPGGAIVDMIKAAVAVAIPLYGARAVSFSLASKIPGLNSIPSKYQGTALAALLALAGHFATKKIGKLAKWRGPIMLGLGLNFLDNAVSALAPTSVRSRIGLSGDLYADGFGDYISVGAQPIDDNMTLSDYVSVNDYVEVGAEQELGASVEEELGLEQELGAEVPSTTGAAYLGGVQQGAMLSPVASISALQTVPARSFTEAVPRAGAGYDNPRNLYGGVFSGGFGG